MEDPNRKGTLISAPTQHESIVCLDRDQPCHVPSRMLGGCKERGEGMEGRSEEIWRRKKLDDHTDMEYKSPGKEISFGQLTDQLILSLPCGS